MQPSIPAFAGKEGAGAFHLLVEVRVHEARHEILQVHSYQQSALCTLCKAADFWKRRTAQDESLCLGG